MAATTKAVHQLSRSARKHSQMSHQKNEGWPTTFKNKGDSTEHQINESKKRLKMIVAVKKRRRDLE